MVLLRVRGWREFSRTLRGALWDDREYLRLERTVDKPEPTCPVGLPALEQSFRWVRADLRELRRWRERARKNTAIPSECWMDLTAGLHWFLGLWNAEELVHIHWVALPGQKTSLPGATVDPGEAEIRGAFTSPTYRSQGFFGAALKRSVGDLGACAVHRVFAYVRPKNVASLRAFQKNRFQVTARCSVRVRLGVHKTEWEKWSGL
jgi:RimJ/RimL family protein N-acetyltransferase